MKYHTTGLRKPLRTLPSPKFGAFPGTRVTVLKSWSFASELTLSQLQFLFTIQNNKKKNLIVETTKNINCMFFRESCPFPIFFHNFRL